ncbi:queuine tRNA-ribosyltransferase [Alphaproteobacteria bacterium]|nr:queuine tRNA-ribosyltransferase [Alphaproteobacteria bacterium]
MKFEITKKLDGTLARTGVISTAHGEIRTPAFIAAATKGTVKALTFAQLDDLGAQSMLVNTYHLLLQPGTDLLAGAGGIHQLANYDKPVFSDSGGFQIMSLPDAKITDEGVTFKSHIDGAKLKMTPESSMQAQHAIGSDIHMAFDCPIGYGDTDTARDNAEKTLQITHNWAERCLVEHNKLSTVCHSARSEAQSQNPNRSHGSCDCAQDDSCTQALFGVVQGGEFEDLRQQSADFFAERDFDGYGIGGMYSSDENGAKLLKIMNNTLPDGKPRHWLGMGAEPRDFFVGVENGIDTFDCVAPTRQARNAALYTHDGRINITNAKYRDDLRPVDAGCECYTCRHHSAAYLHHLFHTNEITGLILATIHNEYFVVHLVDQIRESIENENFIKFRDDWLAQYYRK